MKFIENRNTNKDEIISFNLDEICMLIVLLFSLSTLISLGVMLGQYIYLISNNKTTNENIREIKYPGNVFDQGFKQNWLNIFYSV